MKIEYEVKYDPKNCPRCKDGFICKPENISQCDCMKVRISPEEQNFISQQFKDCICNSCLKELKQAYYQHYQQNKALKVNA